MADSDYLIEIVARLRDEASAKLAVLTAEINRLKASNDASKATQDLGASTDDLGKKADQTARKTRVLNDEHERTRTQAQGAKRDVQDLSKELDKQGRSTSDASTAQSKLGNVHSNVSSKVSGHTRTQREFADALARTREKTDDQSKAARELELRVSKLSTAFGDFDKRVKTGGLSTGETKRGYSDFSRELNKVSRAYEAGSAEAEKFGVMADNAAKKARNAASASTGGFLGSIGRGDGGSALKALSAKFDNLGVRISGVNSTISGFFALAKIGLSQQLITSVVSLAGGLFSLASAATQAGAALAGAFISGIGQAIPVISVALVAAERFKSILEAVTVSSQSEQQKAFDPTAKARTTLQNQSQLISSQQALSNSYIQVFNAQQRVRDSQISLTEARKDAIRNITNLSLAEKSAQLQAEGSDISLEESKRQLQIAIQRGETANISSAELSIKNAELSRRKAHIEVPRAEADARVARQRGVSGSRSVISATEGLSAANQAVVQARQAADAARRQMKITEMTLAAPSSRENASEARLKFLLGQMSAPEKALFTVLKKLEKELKSPNSPIKKISDAFIEPFVDIATRLSSLLNDKSFLSPIENLAHSMGNSVNKIQQAIFGKRGTSFFETMAKDASENLPIITSTIIHLIHLFQDIATAAGPSFHKLIEDWDIFWEKLDRKNSSTQGLSNLEKFFNKSTEYAEKFARLGSALTGLFLALGHDAAPQGLSAVTSLTSAIEKATSWVQSHGPEVTKFFREAKEGLSILGSMLLEIGFSLIKVFSLNSLTAFNGFLSQVLLPGLRNVVTVLGFITTKILDVFNLFGRTGDIILETIGTIIGFGIALAKIVTIIKSIIAFITEMKLALVEFDFAALLNPWTAIGALIAGAAVALGFFDTNQKKVKISAEEVNGALDRQAESLRRIKSLNDEYKASKLGVEEADTRVIQSEQTLAKARKELSHPDHPLSREERSEDRTGIRMDEEALKRAKLSASEARREFEQLPEKQTSTIRSSKEENQKTLSSSRSRSKLLSEELNNLTNKKSEQEQYTHLVGPEGSIIAKEYQKKVSETNNEIIRKNNELKESREKLATATKTSNEIIKSSTEVTARSAKNINEAYEEAFKKFEHSVGKGSESAAKGMAKIRELVDKSLKKYGVSNAEVSNSDIISHVAGNTVSKVSNAVAGFATGAYVPARSGGVYRVAEGGHDEVVLTTDPAQASRQRSLLGQYLQKAPAVARGYAAGGFVADPGTVQTGGSMPQIVAALQRLGEMLHTTIYGISGARTEAQSAALGYPHDPHTEHKAEDIGVGSQLRSSASRLTAAILARVGLERPFYPASAAEINHVQLLGSGSGGIATTKFSEKLEEITAPIIKGGGAIGKVAQNALNITAFAANKYLSKLSPEGSASGSSGATSGSAPIGSSWSGTWVQVMEQIAKAKHWSLEAWKDVVNAESGGNPNSRNPSSGAYGLGQFLGSTLTAYAKYGSTSSNPVKQIEAMAQYISDRYGNPTAAWAHEKANHFYASGGIVGNAPWGGKPVPIVAHEGERVMNPMQYSAAAHMAGTNSSGLDRLFGFASGGKVSNFSLPAFRNILNFSEFDVGSMGSILTIFKTLSEGFKKLKTLNIKSEKYTAELNKFIDEITIETNGVLAVLQKSREILKSRLQKDSVNSTYISTNKGGQLSASKFGGSVPLGGVKLGPGGQTSIDAFSIVNLVDESKSMEKERSVINQSMQKIKADFSRANKIVNKKNRKTALTNLNSNYNKLQERQRELGETLSQNIEARYQAETQLIQDQLAQLESSYQLSSTEISNTSSSLQSLGNFNQIGSLDELSRQRSFSQLSSLEPILQSAEATGNTELVNQIRSQMSSIRQSITNSVVEQLSAAQQAIEQSSSLNESITNVLLNKAKIAEARGNFSESGSFNQQGLENRRSNLLSTRASDEQLRAQAEQYGDIGEVIKLTEKLNENNTQLEENNLALQNNATVTRELTLSQIEKEGQFGKGIYSSAKQMYEIIGQTTGVTNVSGLKKVVEGEGNILGKERSGLEREGSAIGLGVEGMTPTQLIAYFTSPAGQMAMSKIQSSGDQAEKEHLEKVVDGLESNSVATLQNTEELAKLNGQLNQPQSWSTTAWNQFRGAFFNGMGGLLPAYSSALPPGAQPTEMPVYGAASPQSSNSSPTIGNLNLTHPVEKLDPQLLGEQLSFHISQAPSM